MVISASKQMPPPEACSGGQVPSLLTAMRRPDCVNSERYGSKPPALPYPKVWIDSVEGLARLTLKKCNSSSDVNVPVRITLAWRWLAATSDSRQNSCVARSVSRIMMMSDHRAQLT